ncbi:hypothetical protein TNIN_176941 [Trichonephila inaurata madagascariensis]|uniref:Uncharacterized protein n=1 Tax=Trichonephila inaurata madagascariensis TaxID=2747483 RepID=A0A8X6YMD9_9ARAC|nr:hypothetical protein TNIN_176941 [Trichonephila inaurata madagascariensis]
MKIKNQEPLDIKLGKYKHFPTALEDIEQYDRSSKTPLLECLYKSIQKDKRSSLISAISPTQVRQETLYSQSSEVYQIRSTVLYQTSCRSYTVH